VRVNAAATDRKYAVNTQFWIETLAALTVIAAGLAVV
jgi:hypothetical protein